MKRQGSTSPKFTGDERIQLINHEAIKSAQKVVKSEISSEVKVAIGQIFGIELTAGKAHSLSKKSEEYAQKQEKPEKQVATVEHMEYFAEFKRTSENKAPDEATIGIRQQLDSILAELRNLKD